MNSISNKELRKFGIILGVILFVISAIPLLRGSDLNRFVASIAMLSLFLAFAAPVSLKPVHRILIVIGKVLGKINATIILGLVYFLIVTPIGLIKRVFSTGTNRFSYDTNTVSYWVPKQGSDLKESMKRQF